MKARRSSKFGHNGPPTAELCAIEHLKKSHRLINGKTVLPLFLRSFSYDDIHNILNEFEIWPDLTRDYTLLHI